MMILLPIMLVYIQYWIAHHKSRDSMQASETAEATPEDVDEDSHQTFLDSHSAISPRTTSFQEGERENT